MVYFIFVCFKYPSWNQFIKIHVKVFYIKIWLKCETPILFFQMKVMGYRKGSL